MDDEHQEMYRLNMGAIRSVYEADSETAAELSRQAMELGSKSAALRYGNILDARGVARDEVKPYFKIATCSSHPCVSGMAYFWLGLLYFSDAPDVAQEYFLKSAERGEVEALNSYLTLEAKKKPLEVSEPVKSIIDALVAWDPETWDFWLEEFPLDDEPASLVGNRWLDALKEGCGAILRDTENFDDVLSRH